MKLKPILTFIWILLALFLLFSPTIVSAQDKAPTYSNVGFQTYPPNALNENITIIGQPVRVESYWEDDNSLSYAWIEHNNTGTFQNLSFISLSDTQSWVNITITPLDQALSGVNYTLGCLVRARIWANDTSNNLNRTNWLNIVPTVLNIEEEMSWVFDWAYARLVNSSFPYVVTYKVDSGSTGESKPLDILMGIPYFEFTNNMTLLHKAFETADYMYNIANDDHLLSWYKLDTKEWSDYTTITLTAYTILHLAQLANFNKTYVPLLERATDSAITLLVPTDTCRPYDSVYFNGTSKTSNTKSSGAGKFLSALGYAYNITSNSTYRDVAVRIAKNYTYGSANIPYHEVTQEGLHHGDAGTKEDQHFGNWLLGLESLYYFTRNDTIKDLINKTAWYGARYFWHDTYKRFVYTIDADTGAHTDTKAVHGFGMIDEAIFNAYLLFENVTWRDRARSDFDRLAIIDSSPNDILYRNMVTHNTGLSNFGANLDWNSFAVRFARFLSSYFDNSTYLDTYNRLYGAISYCHKDSYNNEYYGYVQAPHANNLGSSYEYTYLKELKNFFAVFRNSSEPISSFDDVFRVLGEPIISAYVDFDIWLTRHLESTNINLRNQGYPYIKDSNGTITVLDWYVTQTKLSFSVYGTSGYTSTTEVYCGNKGKPGSVSGASSWSYDSATKTVTMTIVHSSEKEVIVDWNQRPFYGGGGRSTNPLFDKA